MLNVFQDPGADQGMPDITAYIHVECPKTKQKVYVHAECINCPDFHHIGFQGRFRMYVVCGPRKEAKTESTEDQGDKELIQMEEETSEIG